jgi:hypothetical protein
MSHTKRRAARTLSITYDVSSGYCYDGMTSFSGCPETRCKPLDNGIEMGYNSINGDTVKRNEKEENKDMTKYEANHDGLTVTLSQAFEFETSLDKRAAARKAQESVVEITEAFGIRETNAPSDVTKTGYAIVKKVEGRWYDLYTTYTKEYHCGPLQTTERVTFDTYEQAIEFIQGFSAFFQWMSGFAASTPTQETPTMTAKKDYRINRYIALPITLYQGEDTTERTTGIVKEFDEATRTGAAYIEDGTRIVHFQKRICGKGFKIAS